METDGTDGTALLHAVGRGDKAALDELADDCTCRTSSASLPPSGGCLAVQCAEGNVPTSVGLGCQCVDPSGGEIAPFPSPGVLPVADPNREGELWLPVAGFPGGGLALTEHTAGDPVIGTWSGDACLLPAGHRHGGNMAPYGGQP